MLKLFFQLTVVWPLRLWYPFIRLLGRMIGRGELAEQLIQVSEENIDRTMEALESDNE